MADDVNSKGTKGDDTVQKKSLREVANEHYRRGALYAQTYQVNKAIEKFTQAIWSNSTFPSPYFARANVHGHIGKFEEAISDYSKYIEIYPDEAIAYRLRGISYFSIGNYLNALQDFNNAVKFGITDVGVYVDRGNAHRNLGNYKSTILDYSRAIDMNPSIPEIYCHRGSAFKELHDFNHAFADYEKAIKLSPMDIQARNDFAWFLATCRDKNYRDGKKAVFLAQEAVKRSEEKEPMLFATLASAYAEAGEFPNAIETQKQALSLLNENQVEIRKLIKECGMKHMSKISKKDKGINV